jgi:hypothetical protein
MKTVGAIIGAVLLLYLFVVNFSAVETKYACNGMLTGVDGKGKSDVYVRLKEYRFWVGLWSKSDGDVWVEVPGRMVQYFSHLDKAGDVYGIFDSTGGRFAGNLSMLSRSLNIKLSEIVFFEGTCSPH